MSSSMNFNCWPSHPWQSQAALRYLQDKDRFRLRHIESMDLLQVQPKPAIKKHTGSWLTGSALLIGFLPGLRLTQEIAQRESQVGQDAEQ